MVAPVLWQVGFPISGRCVVAPLSRGACGYQIWELLCCDTRSRAQASTWRHKIWGVDTHVATSGLGDGYGNSRSRIGETADWAPGSSINCTQNWQRLGVFFKAVGISGGDKGCWNLFALFFSHRGSHAWFFLVQSYTHLRMGWCIQIHPTLLYAAILRFYTPLCCCRFLIVLQCSLWDISFAVRCQIIVYVWDKCWDLLIIHLADV